MSKNEIVVVDAKQFLKMVGEIPFSTEQVNLLLKKTPNNFVHERQMPGGGTAKYVSTQYIINSLNLIAGFKWDFEVLEEEEKYGQIVVRGRLSVTAKDGSIISKTQYGRALIKVRKDKTGMLDYGNDKKAAASDALKKCASLLGIAWDIYGQEDMREVQMMKAHEEEVIKAEEAAEMTELPIEDVQSRVGAHLDGITAVEKMRLLKTVRKSTEKSLTEPDWRYLLSQIPEKE